MQLVEVRFKGNRRGFYRWATPDDPLRLDEAVVVEADRGLDLGRVQSAGEQAARKCGGGCASGCATGEAPKAEAEPKVVRRAAPEEARQLDELRKLEEETRRAVMEKVKRHDLAMKVSDTEWQWDRHKLTVYFTSEKRVDFRALVRELAAQFRARIELRQIGVRDEAARLSGVGRCGREYCCSTWLGELHPVSLALAKDQHLSLNPQQISGGCGRLLCCLKYEHDFYVAARKRFPKEGKSIVTAAGTEKVVAVDIFRERVFLRGEEGHRIIPLVQLKEEVEQRGAVLPTPETRARPAAAEPPARPPEPAPGAAAEPSPARRRRRGRRGKGRGPDTPPAAPPSA
ncbi:MAG TPA: regulatory iron-sulfur-containing complex subunit RicT [Gemmatimonadales bacterium]|jgi:cell fate regulator YaaT (PSP1 superfamily)|nr:regulatory iron-sulfur-containing complex subunit RicT [Gemmatimonadales bacterium]